MSATIIHDKKLDAVINEFTQNSLRKKYSWLPYSVEQFKTNEELESQAVAKIILRLMEKFSVNKSPISLPLSVTKLYERELVRIKKTVECKSQGALRFSSDARLKDIAILTFRLIPVGAEFAEPWQGIPRRILLASPTQIASAINFFIIKRNGFYPYFSLHMHQESHQDFHEEGWMQTFMRLSELLESNIEHGGWYSSSWFVDPAIETISPHLAYLRTVPEHNGGAVFFVEKDVTGKSGALSTSRTRRRLFDQGIYHPRIYLRVWPRKAAIAWGHTMEANNLSD